MMQFNFLRNSTFACVIFITVFISPEVLAINSAKILGTDEAIVIPQYASTITDPSCKEPVDSFDLSSKLTLLTKVTLSIGVNSGNYKEGLKVAKTMNWLPTDMEILLGEKLHDARKKSHSFINPKTKNKRYAKLYKKSNQALNDILNAFPEKLPFPIKLYITTDKGINASAQPGGYIYLTKKAAEKDKNFLVTILSHEIFHITKRHTTLQYQSNIIDAISTVGQFKSLINSGTGNINEITNLASTTANLIMSYTQKQEAQADVCAGHLLVRLNGYDTDKGIMEFVDESKNRKKASNPLFADHPAAEDRLKLFQFAINDKETSLAWDAKRKENNHLSNNKSPNIQTADNTQKVNDSLKEKKENANETTTVPTKKGPGEKFISDAKQAKDSISKALGSLFN